MVSFVRREREAHVVGELGRGHSADDLDRAVDDVAFREAAALDPLAVAEHLGQRRREPRP
jgi:hypothetical protein